jgi:hypothetical protein
MATHTDDAFIPIGADVKCVEINYIIKAASILYSEYIFCFEFQKNVKRNLFANNIKIK